MSSTSTAKRPRRVSPLTSAMRDRQRSMTESLAVTTSRSTTGQPGVQGSLGFATADLHVFVHADGAAEKRVAAPRIAIDQETSVPQDLHSEDRRRLVEVDEVDVAVESPLQILAGIEDLESRRAPAEKGSEVEVRAWPGRPTGLGAEQPQGLQPEPPVQEAHGFLEIVAGDHGAVMVAERPLLAGLEA